jgi:hypothetical protein
METKEKAGESHVKSKDDTDKGGQEGDKKEGEEEDEDAVEVLKGGKDKEEGQAPPPRASTH